MRRLVVSQFVSADTVSPSQTSFHSGGLIGVTTLMPHPQTRSAWKGERASSRLADSRTG
jgi:hypothetical protein